MESKIVSVNTPHHLDILISVHVLARERGNHGLILALHRKLGSLVVVGNRPAAIRVLGKHVMSERGLQGLAIDTLRSSTTEYAELFALLLNPAKYPLHLYCQQGKDRTGLSIILIYLLLDVPHWAIKEDYMLSQSQLQPEMKERLQELREMSLPESFAACDEGLVDAVVQWLNSHHGGIEGYLSSIGIDKSAQNRLRDQLEE